MKTEDDIWFAATAYFAELGIDGLMYADLTPNTQTIKTSLKSDWTERYAAQDYVKVDPFFLYCCNSYAAMDIGPDCVRDHDYMSGKEKQFIADASDTGMIAGFASPIRVRSQQGLAGWSFLSSHGRDLINNLRQKQEYEMRLVGSIVHQQMCVLKSKAHLSCDLTPREIEALQWTAQGLRTAMIAEKMKLRTVTVDFHLRNAREKMGAKTRDQAVALALVQGVIAL